MRRGGTHQISAAAAHSRQRVRSDPLALLTGLIKPEQISTVADFFISIMPVLFIAPTVALITQPEHLAVMGGPVVLLGILGTTLVIGISGKAAQAVGRQEAKRREGKKHE